MSEHFGLTHFWAQSDAVTHATAIILALLSVASWYVILSKVVSHWRYRLSCERALEAFWDADSLALAVENIRRDDPAGLFSSVALAGARAAHAHQKHAAKGIGAAIDASDFITRALRQGIVVAQARIEHGLTFLASVGATAPFVGLFGTVWGIYHALIGLAGATQVVLDKVAGPVGEALIMTAGGLFVAIPAVLAYNACVRANRLVLAQLDGFTHDLHAFLTTGIKLRDSRANLIDLNTARQANAA
jgi:biopolymer transport protein ExbB